MITAEEFVAACARHGFTMAVGVPCSYFAGPIALLTRRGCYVPAANEGIACAVAAGAVASGGRAVVLAQNSGLGNLLNPLTSLLLPYRIPVLFFLSMRGWPDGRSDEPQHAVMGTTSERLLEDLGLWRRWLPDTADGFQRLLADVDAELARGRPAFCLVRRGDIGDGTGGAVPLAAPAAEAGFPSRRRAIQEIVGRLPTALVVSTTGHTSRDLFSLGHDGRFFYMQGSMGHAAAFGLGIALVHRDRQVVVLDGDGAVLMHLGCTATIAAAAPRRFVHVVLDNGRYESTGGQETPARTTSFRDVGRAVGYRTAIECRTLAELAAALDGLTDADGPCLVVVKTAPTMAAAPPRATSAMEPTDITSSFTAACRAPA